MVIPVSSASARFEPVAVAGPSSERAAVLTVALATMLAPLNSTMIAVALPHVITEFGADVASAGWLVTASLIAMAAPLREVVPAQRRAGRFGLVGAAVALAAAAGPPLGGLLVGTAGWRAIFYVNLLFILPTLAIGWRALPGEPRRR